MLKHNLLTHAFQTKINKIFEAINVSTLMLQNIKEIFYFINYKKAIVKRNRKFIIFNIFRLFPQLFCRG